MIYGADFRYDVLMNSVKDLKTRIDKTNYSITTGNKAQTFADQPNVSAFISLKTSSAQRDQYIINAETAETRLKMVDSAMTGMEKLVNDALRASDVTNYDDASSSNLVSMAAQWQKAAIDFLNTRGDDGYIFGGTKTDTMPVDYAEDPTSSKWRDTGTGAAPGFAAGVPNGTFKYTTPPFTMVNPDAVDSYDMKDPLDLPNPTVVAYRDYYYQGGPGVDLTTGASSDSLKIRVDRDTEISVGFSAAESGFEKMLRGMHILSQAPLPADPLHPTAAEEQAFLGFCKNANGLLKEAAVELRGIHMRAASSMSFVKDKIDQHQEIAASEASLIDKAQSVDKAEAIMELQELGTKLNASYSVISKLQQFSLVNYLK